MNCSSLIRSFRLPFSSFACCLNSAISAMPCHSMFFCVFCIAFCLPTVCHSKLENMVTPTLSSATGPHVFLNPYIVIWSQVMLARPSDNFLALHFSWFANGHGRPYSLFFLFHLVRCLLLASTSIDLFATTIYLHLSLSIITIRKGGVSLLSHWVVHSNWRHLRVI